ncbi:L-gulonolactone oxidase-like, partial [Stegodyphus dumicola]|uniref:L-gulonolactone oxidase-like n=1 Tax=Stegodyphus dumicola TaxID=202533 RepID=UPI0015A818CF
MNTTKVYNVLKTGIQNVHFKNWSETFQCRPELFFIPSTEEEIKQILEFAREKRKKVRVVGCRHSPSDIACTDDVMISLKNFNRILKVDKKNLQVMVEAGAVISDLNESLYSHNLALPVLGSTSNISIGGAISVATHGSGIRYGTLSTYVTELDLMLSDGSVKKFSADRDKELFLAAVCSLGSFGIILRVSLQCEAAFNLQLRQYSLGLQDVIEHLDVHIEGSDHFRFMWFPYTEGVVVCHSQRTEKPITKVSWLQKCYDWFWNYGIGYYSLEFCYYLSYEKHRTQEDIQEEHRTQEDPPCADS